jgi:uncharacterized protein
MPKSFISIFIIAGMIASCNTQPDITISTADTSATAKDTAKYGEMKKYWLVLLYKGNNRTHDSATAARIQEKHIANIDRLASEGKVIMAGPMGYDKDIRGIFIMDCKDSMEAVSLVQTDTAVITGRLRFEVHPWWTAKGKYEFK